MRERQIVIIAEAGVNHNGSLDAAMALIDAAADAGADVVKFQTFQADRLATATAPMANYQCEAMGTSESQLTMLRRLELSEESHRQLIARCGERGIRFLSTPFDLESLSLLVDYFNLPEIKLGSGELTNAPLLLASARTGRRIILSTGMGTLGEVEAALGVLAFGYTTEDSAQPCRAAFDFALGTAAARAILLKKVVLLHCTTEYPAPVQDVNLRAMDTLRAAFGLPVGYSDHTQGIAVSIAAAARGAAVIEKHFTLDRSLPGPDHAASLEPDELTRMIEAIRQVEVALGDGIKMPRASERKNAAIARKSIVAARHIAKGEHFSVENLTTKRPGGARSPYEFWDLLGQSADKTFNIDDPV